MATSNDDEKGMTPAWPQKYISEGEGPKHRPHHTFIRHPKYFVDLKQRKFLMCLFS
jgi:hypothetical protein